MNAEDLYHSPNALAPHYSRFCVTDRLLLTGHSHQAWPDCGFEAQQQAWLDAAAFADGKWDRAFEQSDRVRLGFGRLIDDTKGHIALGANTHELVVRFLSALPLRSRPRLVTTDGEFHTIRRQLDRLHEEHIEIVKVSALPASSVVDRLTSALDGRTAAVLVSAVFYHNAHIVPGLGELLRACRDAGAELLIDAYHALDVMPLSVRDEQLEGAFIVGGGYKYCQLGEGNCFLRFPEACQMRPVITGWFSEFDTLADSQGKLVYGEGAARFAGATYDPTSHYRAAAVFAFFEQHALTPAFLRRISQHQVGVLIQHFDDLDVDPAIITRDRSVSLEEVGGFLALQTPHADRLCRMLSERGVRTDYRDGTLRFGPAPYLSDAQLQTAMGELREAVRTL